MQQRPLDEILLSTSRSEKDSKGSGHAVSGTKGAVSGAPPSTSLSSASSQGNNNSKASAYITGLVKKSVAGVISSNRLPDEDENRYYSSFPSFSNPKKRVGGKILATIERIGKFLFDARSKEQLSLSSGDSRSQLNKCIDFSDKALETVDMKIDMIRSGDPGNLTNAQQKAMQSRIKRHKGHVSFLQSSGAMSKPQLQFKDKIDNFSRPFIPKLRSKPNAIAPLPNYSKLKKISEASSKNRNGGGRNQSEDDDDDDVGRHLMHLGIEVGPDSSSSSGNGGNTSDSKKSNMDVCAEHPYGPELKQFNPPQHQLKPTKEHKYGSLDQTPCSWVDTEEKLHQLVDKLTNTEGGGGTSSDSSKVKEIAVDLEHHSYRTYQGFTCLMQISTRDEDFLVDTLALRHEMHVLNKVFTDPDVVKVLHGADSDILWLQKDFGIYVVNMFDTGQAARLMSMPSFGLAYLLRHYCNVNTDKKYQLADWRCRPLPAEMLLYARQDTHYLLYIYDRIRNDILAKRSGDSGASALLTVFERSRDLCLQRYEVPALSPTEAVKFVRKKHLALTDEQMTALKGLLEWRDMTARKMDESIAFVMPNRTLLQLVQHRPLDRNELVTVCRPLPPVVRDRAEEILTILRRAAEGLDDSLLSPLKKQLEDSKKQLDADGFDLTTCSPTTSPPVPRKNQLYRDAKWGVHHPGRTSIEGGEASGMMFSLFDSQGIVERAKASSDALLQVSITINKAAAASSSLSSSSSLSPSSPSSSNLFRMPMEVPTPSKKATEAVIDSILSSMPSPRYQPNHSATAASHHRISSSNNGGVSNTATMEMENPVASSTDFGTSNTSSKDDDKMMMMTIQSTPSKPKHQGRGDGGSDDDNTLSKHLISPEMAAGSMPRTIREIYKLSNTNRRKNKDRGISKENRKGGGGGSRGSNGDPSAASKDNVNWNVPFPDVVENKSSSMRERSGRSFMEDIGWLDKGEEIRPASSSRLPPSSTSHRHPRAANKPSSNSTQKSLTAPSSSSTSVSSQYNRRPGYHRHHHHQQQNQKHQQSHHRPSASRSQQQYTRSRGGGRKDTTSRNSNRGGRSKGQRYGRGKRRGSGAPNRSRRN